ncbi:unnamed protein product, partial [Symbiodinium sp. KB8]
VSHEQATQAVRSEPAGSPARHDDQGAGGRDERPPAPGAWPPLLQRGRGDRHRDRPRLGHRRGAWQPVRALCRDDGGRRGFRCPASERAVGVVLLPGRHGHGHRPLQARGGVDVRVERRDRDRPRPARPLACEPPAPGRRRCCRRDRAELASSWRRRERCRRHPARPSSAGHPVARSRFDRVGRRGRRRVHRADADRRRHRRGDRRPARCSGRSGAARLPRPRTRLPRQPARPPAPRRTWPRTPGGFSRLCVHRWTRGGFNRLGVRGGGWCGGGPGVAGDLVRRPSARRQCRQGGQGQASTDPDGGELSAHRRPPAPRRRARHRQDHPRQGDRRLDLGQLDPRAVHPRPASERHHRRHGLRP